ncbi:MAG TPA: protein translocase subunit SecF, partial [bacterium]|nr:protein translocase subunit SecF [bacterium]
STLLADLRTTFGEPVEGTQSIEEVSPTIRGELINRALQGLFWGNLLVFLYITLRMRLDFAFFGIVALLHDLAITTGFMAVMSYHAGWEINSWFVAVILTILGYSINDIIVIYDRIRENLHLYAGHPFPTIVNFSLVQTMTRSINTSVTVVLVLGAMLIGQTLAGGSGGLKEFNATMLAGVISGAYSTIFIASQLLVAYYRYKERRGGVGFVANPAAAAAASAAAAHTPVVAQVRTIEPKGPPAGPRTISGAEIMGAPTGGPTPATANGATLADRERAKSTAKPTSGTRVKKKRW